MPLITRRTQGNTGPIVLLLMGVALVVVMLLAWNDPCPEGFVRQCFNVLWGKLTGSGCECVAQADPPV